MHSSLWLFQHSANSDFMVHRFQVNENSIDTVKRNTKFSKRASTNRTRKTILENLFSAEELRGQLLVFLKIKSIPAR